MSPNATQQSLDEILGTDFFLAGIPACEGAIIALVAGVRSPSLLIFCQLNVTQAGWNLMSDLPDNKLTILEYLDIVTDDVRECRAFLDNGSPSPTTEMHSTWNDDDLDAPSIAGPSNPRKRKVTGSTKRKSDSVKRSRVRKGKSRAVDVDADAYADADAE